MEESSLLATSGVSRWQGVYKQETARRLRSAACPVLRGSVPRTADPRAGQRAGPEAMLAVVITELCSWQLQQMAVMALRTLARAHPGSACWVRAACYKILYGFKGTPSARQAGPGPGRSRVLGRGSPPRETASRSRDNPAASAGSRGTHLLRGDSLPRPTGDSPPAAALPRVGRPAPAGSRYSLQRAPVTAPL